MNNSTAGFKYSYLLRDRGLFSASALYDANRASVRIEGIDYKLNNLRLVKKAFMADANITIDNAILRGSYYIPRSESGHKYHNTYEASAGVSVFDRSLELTAGRILARANAVDHEVSELRKSNLVRASLKRPILVNQNPTYWMKLQAQYESNPKPSFGKFKVNMSIHASNVNQKLGTLQAHLYDSVVPDYYNGSYARNYPEFIAPHKPEGIDGS